MKLPYLLAFICATITVCCESQTKIVGLWSINSVTIGDTETTPNARWIRFNPDSTQESGNGWFQHSIGHWSLDKKTNNLRIANTNGLINPDEVFKMTFSGDDMIWTSTEGAETVKIRLIRTTKLPPTFGDELLGLWQMDKAVGNGNYFEESENTDDYIFFRWDKRFVIHANNNTINGVYNVHGHKPELELIPYGESVERSFWNIQFNDNTILLKLLNSDSLITRRFKRIHAFPD